MGVSKQVKKRDNAPDFNVTLTTLRAFGKQGKGTGQTKNLHQIDQFPVTSVIYYYATKRRFKTIDVIVNIVVSI